MSQSTAPDDEASPVSLETLPESFSKRLLHLQGYRNDSDGGAYSLAASQSEREVDRS